MKRLTDCIIKAITLVESWNPEADAETKRKMIWQLIEMQCPNFLGEKMWDEENIHRAIDNLIDAYYIVHQIVGKVTGKDLFE